MTVYGRNNDWKRFRVIPLISELSGMAFRYKRSLMKKYGIDDEKELNDVPVFAAEYNSKKNRWKNSSYDAIRSICKKATDSLPIGELKVLLPGEKEVVTDLNRYYSDTFLANFRHYANHTCFMTNGEINYLLGVNAEDTFAKHYCDYTNDAVQFAMYRKLERWMVILYTDTSKDGKRLADGVEYTICGAESDVGIDVTVSDEFGSDISVLRYKVEE